MSAIDMIPREQMVTMLQKHRETFARYARNHRDKVPTLRTRRSQTKADSPTDKRLAQQIVDTLEKAKANEALVEEIDALIGKPKDS